MKASVNLGARLGDTELLSLAYNLPETIVKLQDDKAYLNVKDSALLVLAELGLSLEDGVYTSMKVANANINSRDDAKLYLQILLAFFQDIVNYNLQGRLLLPSFDDTTAKLSRVIKNPLRHTRSSLKR